MKTTKILAPLAAAAAIFAAGSVNAAPVFMPNISTDSAGNTLYQNGLVTIQATWGELTANDVYNFTYDGQTFGGFVKLSDVADQNNGINQQHSGFVFAVSNIGEQVGGEAWNAVSVSIPTGLAFVGRSTDPASAAAARFADGHTWTFGGIAGSNTWAKTLNFVDFGDPLTYDNEHNPSLFNSNGGEFFGDGLGIALLPDTDAAKVQVRTWDADLSTWPGYDNWKDDDVLTFSFYTLSTTPASTVPEPGTLLMLSSGLICVGIARRRQARK